MKTIQILCPVFREEDGILIFHDRLKKALDPLRDRYSFGFIYAVDPAGDRTEDILLDLAGRSDDVEVLVMSRRFGHQAALIAGIDASVADALIMLDSDGQHPPELIPTLVERWESGAEIVQTLRQDGKETPFLKRTTSALFYKLISGIGSIDLKSGAADYRLLSRRVVEVLRDQLTERNVFLRGLVTWIGYNIAYVEFQPERRQFGASNYRTSILFNFALQGISSFSKTPLRICTITGLAIASLSVLLGLVFVAGYIAGPSRVPGWASLVTFITFLGGVQLFFMGIFGEYLGQIFDEVKQRPRYLVARRGSPGGGLINGSKEHV
ncbi:dolichol-phosphate mannosyltransferase [Luteibacter sp. UNC138MFCol5.1]|uniref:glycosyltransferase family 2 protein n=1 Tax=Luteibacter sp. UNC138MFCol5.1 TaxID=1502774 RepID=UPI0008B2DF14|nr:glycosyltransferase family 2 protein [Luteibacter sp. UNC138MFCol5.1]SEP05607.1 dolichol-phosphate mannosyltransferase [Luteibacter sp. UNC138MFCol5.1]